MIFAFPFGCLRFSLLLTADSGLCFSMNSLAGENLGGYLIREQINKTDDNKASLADVRCLNLQRLVQAEVTSENPEYPVDWRGCRGGWGRAGPVASPGPCFPSN